MVEVGRGAVLASSAVGVLVIGDVHDKAIDVTIVMKRAASGKDSDQRREIYGQWQIPSSTVRMMMVMM